MKPLPEIKYAAIYARVSTEDQGKGFSIPTQIEASRKLADREGYIVREGQTLVDEGLSGTTMDRPGLRKVRELVNAGAIAAVIVYDPDRLSRNLGHQLLLAEEFEQASVKLLIVSHPMEKGPEGWLFFQMRGALAEYERAKLLERTHRGRIGRVKAGHPGGGSVPFGYHRVREPHRGRLEIDEETAPIVRRIFKMYANGDTIRTIAKHLTTERVPTKFDREGSPKQRQQKRYGHGVWSITLLQRMLRNSTYAGRAYWNKRATVTPTTRRLRPREEWIEIAVPAIIEEKLFQQVQRRLELNKALSRRNRKREYLLNGGRLRCGRCGRVETGSCAKARNIRYYKCSSHYATLNAAAWCRGSIRADEAETKVWGKIEQMLQHPEIIAQEVLHYQHASDQTQREIAHELQLISSALGRCDREGQRWAEAYAAEVIDLKQFQGYKAEIEVRRQSLFVQQAECKRAQSDAQELLQHGQSLIDYCGRVREHLRVFTLEEKRLAFEALDLKIAWTPGEPLRIQACIPIDPVMSIPSSWKSSGTG
jgi:site-specific DNA recombinase